MKPSSAVTSLAQRIADAAGLVTAAIGLALVLAPARSAKALGLGADLRRARIIGLADVALAPGLLAGRPRWPWMTARAGLNALVAAHYRAEADQLQAAQIEPRRHGDERSHAHRCRRRGDALRRAPLIVGLAVMVACGLAVGWSWNEGLAAALAAVGLLLLLRFTLVWIGIYLGLLLETPESAVAVQILVRPGSPSTPCRWRWSGRCCSPRSCFRWPSAATSGSPGEPGRPRRD